MSRDGGAAEQPEEHNRRTPQWEPTQVLLRCPDKSGPTWVVGDVLFGLGASVYDWDDPFGRLFPRTLAMVAEFEANLHHLRTREGMVIAKRKGKLKGKQPELPESGQRSIRRRYDTGEVSLADLAEEYSAGRSIIHRVIHRGPAPDPVPTETTDEPQSPPGPAGRPPLAGGSALAAEDSGRRWPVDDRLRSGSRRCDRMPGTRPMSRRAVDRPDLRPWSATARLHDPGASRHTPTSLTSGRCAGLLATPSDQQQGIGGAEAADESERRLWARRGVWGGPGGWVAGSGGIRFDGEAQRQRRWYRWRGRCPCRRSPGTGRVLLQAR